MDKHQFVDKILAIAGASKIDLIKRDQLERLFEKIIAEDLKEQIEKRVDEALEDRDEEISELEETIENARYSLESAINREDWDDVSEVADMLHA